MESSYLHAKRGLTIKTLLTIAGHDPSSGAGVTADLAVMAAHGYSGTSAVTALTVQSTVAVRATHPVESRILADALDCIVEDMPPAGVKIGMLATGANVRVVCSLLERLRAQGLRSPVVLDPVMRATSGRALLDEDGVCMLREALLPLVDWATPNFSELEVLLGRRLKVAAELELAAAELVEANSRLNLVCTGGDADAADDLVLLGDRTREWLRGEKLLSTSTHGTGCAFASALVCRLSDGVAGVEAARLAKQYVTEGIRRAEPRGAGKGPLDLWWPRRQNGAAR